MKPHQLFLLVLLLTTSLLRAAERPNVVFILSDDLMKQIGVYGHDAIATPELNKLAGQSMVFDRAYCQYPLCGPSRASLFLGTQPNRSGITWNQGGKSSVVQKKAGQLGIKTMPAHFREHGYVTVGGGKLYHDTVIPGTDSAKFDFNVALSSAGKDGQKAKGPGKKRKTLITQASPYDVYEHKDGALIAEAKKWLTKNARADEDKPFFMCLGLKKPHSPYSAPKRFFDLYERDAMPITDIKAPNDILTHYSLSSPNALLSVHADTEAYDGDTLPDAKKREMIHGYRACIAYIDFLIGDLVKSLKQAGQYENTIIIVASDHGYKLGEYDRWAKFTLHEKDLAIPFIVRVPMFHKGHGTRTKAIVGLIDIYPTLAELCGVPIPRNIDGKSFAGTLRGNEKPARKRIHSFVGRAEKESADGKTHPKATGVSVIANNGFRYTEWWQGAPDQFPVAQRDVIGPELYDHYGSQNTPISTKNLAAEKPAMLNAMRAALIAEGQNNNHK